MKALVLGVGTNDATYPVYGTSGNRNNVCPLYSRWVKMLTRCYDPYYLNERMTYIDCYVCDEWLNFSSFKQWMDRQDWVGKQLDKDIIVPGNKIYCPDACAFVLTATNNFILTKGDVVDRNVGATFDNEKGKWRCQISINGKIKNLGRFATEAEAVAVYKKKKYELAVILAEKETDARIKNALIKRFEVNQQPAGQEQE